MSKPTTLEELELLRPAEARRRHALEAHAMSDLALAHALTALAGLEASELARAVLLEAAMRLELELALEVTR